MIQHSEVSSRVKTVIPFSVYHLNPSLTKGSEELSVLLTRYQEPGVEELIEHVCEVAGRPTADDPLHYSLVSRADLYSRMLHFGRFGPRAIKNGNQELLSAFEKSYEKMRDELNLAPNHKTIRLLFAVFKGYSAEDLIEFHRLADNTELYNRGGGSLWQTDYYISPPEEMDIFQWMRLAIGKPKYDTGTIDLADHSDFPDDLRSRIIDAMHPLVYQLENHFERLPENSYGVKHERSFEILDLMVRGNILKPKTPPLKTKLTIVR